MRNDFHFKAIRLGEMGFSYDMCMNALNASGGDENVAANELLTGANSAAATPVVAPTQTSSKPSGLFGKVWGRN